MNDALPLSIQQIHKHFGKKHVLNDVSFDVQKGEIFGLIGLNGAGKTTLIKIMLDLLKADSGNIQFFGTCKTNPHSRKSIHYLPERFTPSSYLKGKEFLELAARFYHQSIDMNAARAGAESLGLDPDALDKTVGHYSKGMGQKLGLLSAFLGQAPLLVLDEPMSGLDPSARIQLKELLNQHKSQGNTTFFSSHILSDIDEICDRIAVLHNHRVLYTGTPKAFKERFKQEHLERAFLAAIEKEPASIEAA